MLVAAAQLCTVFFLFGLQNGGSEAGDYLKGWILKQPWSLWRLQFDILRSATNEVFVARNFLTFLEKSDGIIIFFKCPSVLLHCGYRTYQPRFFLCDLLLNFLRFESVCNVVDFAFNT